MVSFTFPDCGNIPPPVIMVQHVSFRYSSDQPLVYNNIDFGIDLESRIALVGPNGAGKSTLLKLIDGEVHTCTCIKIYTQLTFTPFFKLF